MRFYVIGLMCVGLGVVSAWSQDLTDAATKRFIESAKVEVTKLGVNAPSNVIEKTMSDLIARDEVPKLAGKLDVVVINGLAKYAASLGAPRVVIPDFAGAYLKARQEASFEERTALLKGLMNCYKAKMADTGPAIMTALGNSDIRYLLPWVEISQRGNQPDGGVEFTRLEQAVIEKGKNRPNGARAVRMIEGSPLVQDPPALNVYSNGETTLLHRMGQILSRAEDKDALGKLPQSAGRDLLMIYVTSDISSINDWCERYGEKVLALPKDQQMGLAVYFSKDVPPIPLEGALLGLNFSETTKKTLTTLRQLGSDTALKKIENLGAGGERPSDQLAELRQQLDNGVFTRLIRSDYDKAMALFQRVTALEAELERNIPEARKRTHFQGTLSSQLIRDVKAPLDANDIVGVAFVLHILRLEEGKPEKTRGRMDLTDFTLNSMNSTVRQTLGSLVREPKDVETFKEGFAKLANAFKREKHFEILAPGLIDIFKHGREEHKDHLLAWLEEKPQQTLAPNLATEIAMALRFAKHVKASRVAGSVMRPAEAYYHRYLSDAYRMKGLRLRKALHLVSTMGRNTHPKVVNETVDLLATQWGRGRQVSGEPVISTIKLFLEQKQTPPWRIRAKRVAAAWSKSSAAGLTSNGDNRLLLDLQTAANGDKGVSQSLARLEQNPRFESDLNSIAVLVRVGELDRAAKLLQDRWEAMLSDRRSEEAFDDTISKQLPAFLQKFPAEDVRFYAETLLVTAPPVAGISELAANDRRKRLLDLTARFEGQNFDVLEMKERSRDRLLSIPEARKQMEGVLDEKASAVNLATLLSGNQIRKALPTLVDHMEFLRRELEKGNTDRFLKDWSDIQGVKLKGPSLEMAYGTLAVPLAMAFDTVSANWTPAEAAKFKPLALKMLAGDTRRPVVPKPGGVSHRRVKTAKVGTIIFLHADGSMKELNAWYDGITEENARRKISGTMTSSCREILTYIAKIPDASKRVALVKDYVTSPIVQDAVDAVGMGVFSAIKRSDALSIEEFLEHRDQLTKPFEKSVRAQYRIAAYLNSENLHELALPYVQKAISLNDGSKENSARLSRSQLLLGSLLRRTGKFEEAEAVLTKLTSRGVEPERQRLGWSRALANKALGSKLASMDQTLNGGKGWQELAVLWRLLRDESAGSPEEATVLQKLNYHSLAKDQQTTMTNRTLEGIEEEIIQQLVEQHADAEIIPRESTWHYSDANADLGDAWLKTDYEDAHWKSGPAPMGYGHIPKATVIGTESNLPLTAYFRKEFQIDDPAKVKSLVACLLRGHGAIGYLNGVEIFRQNMPQGEIAFDTLAVKPVFSSPYANYWNVDIPSADLRKGPNVLAIEVHQGSKPSRDMSFDLQLLANIPPATERMRVTEEDLRQVLQPRGAKAPKALLQAISTAP